MITVHDRTVTVFTANGYGALDTEIINPQVAETIGGDYSLTFTYPADGQLAGHLLLENIVAAPTPTSQLRQGFRISQVRTELDGMLHVTALHVSFDLAANLIADTFVVNKTPQSALAQILGAAQYSHGFTATSADMATVASARIVRASVLAAIMDAGAENSFASRWGGELARDNWRLHHAPRLGADRGVVIRDGKSLTGYHADIDYTTVATRVLPVGYDGLLLPELYVDSPRLGDYQFPLVRVVKFDQIKAIHDPVNPREDELPLPQALDALRQATTGYFAGGADLPTATYRINFVELSQTKEYAQFADLENVNLGDTVTVIHDDLGVRLTARVTAYTYDPLAKAYIALELGGAASKFTSVTRAVQKIQGEVSDALATAGVALTSADGKTTNHYGTAQPARAALGDTWFRQNGELIEIWVYTLTGSGEPGWVAVATDLNQAQLAADLAEARGEVEAAALKAEEARHTAEQTVLELTAKTDDITEAKIAADDAEQKAQVALEASGQVQAYAEQVAGDLAEVSITAASALSTAQNAEAAAQTVTTGLATANTQIAQARTRADNAYTLANTANSGVQALTLTVADAESNLQSQISVLATDINLRVTQGEVIAQINISPETILIDGKRIHITGTTTIDNSVIKTAMIADAAITNAKIGSLDASKITTGYLAAARLQAGSITSDKLTIATGFIETAMIANAAITDAKIASLSAAKITTGYLAAARIQAGSITSDKLTIATGFIETAMIANAAITDAKIGSLSAAKITTGTLAAARIAAGSITSDKLTIANAFIKTAMIADLAITSAKIAALDAAKITTGTLLAARIAAGSITADKLAANAIQVGLAGWTSSIRITPTQIAWYNGSTMEGSLTSSGMRFYYGTRYIGEMARRQKKDAPAVQGIVNQLANTGDYVSWTYQTVANGDFYTCLTLDPKGTFYGQKGIHLGDDLRTRGYKMYTTGNRYVTLQDCTLTGHGTYPGWVGHGTAKLVFATNTLMFVTGGSYYSFTSLISRMNELISRMNSLIGRLNNGWVAKINDLGNGRISWSSYANSGLSTMSTTLS